MLAFAALGLAAAPRAPVEALVALNIVMVRSEIIRKQRGDPDLYSRYPWLTAFLLGLLHGFGFGGALRRIVLPQPDVPLALLAFNRGVEAGELLFVGIAPTTIGCLRRLQAMASDRPRLTTAYMVGSVSAFWFVQRLAAFGG